MMLRKFIGNNWYETGMGCEWRIRWINILGNTCEVFVLTLANILYQVTTRTSSIWDFSILGRRVIGVLVLVKVSVRSLESPYRACSSNLYGKYIHIQFRFKGISNDLAKLEIMVKCLNIAARRSPSIHVRRANLLSSSGEIESADVFRKICIFIHLIKNPPSLSGGRIKRWENTHIES